VTKDDSINRRLARVGVPVAGVNAPTEQSLALGAASSCIRALALGRRSFDRRLGLPRVCAARHGTEERA
jgi:hypothetical protein